MTDICKELWDELFTKFDKTGKFSPEERSLLYERLNEEQKRLADKSIEDSKRIITKYRRKLEEELTFAEETARKNAMIDEIIEAKLETELDLYDNPWEGIQAILVGLVNKKAGAGFSVDAIQKGILNTKIGRLMKKLEKQELFKELDSGVHDDDIIREGYELAWSAKDIDVFGNKETLNPGITKNKTAQKIAKILHEAFTDMDLESNRSGAAIDKNRIGNFFRQTHNRALIVQKGMDDWVKYLMDNDLLDQEATFMGDPQQVNILQAIFTSIRDGDAIISHGSKLDLGGGLYADSRYQILKAFSGRDNIAKRASRKSNPFLVFKNAEAQIQYNAEFGSKGLLSNVIYDMETMSRNLGLMKRMGTNPRGMLSKLRNRARNISSRKITMLDRSLEDKDLSAADIKKNKKLLKDIKNKRVWVEDRSVDRWMDTLDGTDLRIMGDGSWGSLAGFSASIRALQSMAKLGGATISAFTDIPLAAAELRSSQGLGTLESYFSGIASVFRGRGSTKQRQLARTMGLGLDGILGSIHSKFGAVDSAPGQMTKLMQKFFSLNLMNWWNDSHRTGMALMMSRNMATHSRRSFDKLPKQLKETLEMYDITEAEWDIYRKFGIDDLDGEKYMTNENLNEENIGTDFLLRYMYKKLKEKEVFIDEKGNLRKGDPDEIGGTQIPEGTGLAIKKGQIVEVGKEVDVKTEFELYYKDFGRNQNAKEEALSNLRLKLNTMYINRADSGVIMPGAYERSLSTAGGSSGTWLGEFTRHIMQFKAFPITVLRKAMGRERYSDAPVANITQLMLSTTVFGYMALATKDILKGREPRSFADGNNWDRARLFRAAMTQGGGFGIYGDFLFGEYNRYGKSALATVVGPALGQVDDLATLYSKVMEGDDFGASLFRLGINNAPGANLFYTRWALDYMLLYEIQEAINPGYLSRVEKRIMEENNQRFYLPPSRHSSFLGADL